VRLLKRLVNRVKAKRFVKHDFLPLDALWNDARFVDHGWIAARPRGIETT
jgi:hypothetical protein